MGKKDPRVDSYIEQSAPFAQPVLKHLRGLVHQGCPEVEETLKWRMPSFLFKGILCMMAAFKQHATFGFWKSKLILGETGEQPGMGNFGRITSLKDLPSDKILLGHIRKAVELNEGGVKAPRGRVKPGQGRDLAVPDFFATALRKNKQAKASFDKFSYSHKKEYIEWLLDAKRDETRQRRLKTAVAQIARGKPQNWKYMNC